MLFLSNFYFVIFQEVQDARICIDLGLFLMLMVFTCSFQNIDDLAFLVLQLNHMINPPVIISLILSLFYSLGG